MALSPLPQIQKNTEDTVFGIGKSNDKLDDLNKSYDRQSNLLEGFIESVKQQQTKMDLLKDNKSGSGAGVSGGKGFIGNTLSGAGDAASGLGGLLAGVGGFAGGLGMAGGALLAGAGILVAGGGYLLEQLNEFDGKKIRANVNELFGIADDASGLGNFFAEGGTFFVTMTAIGAGLGVFAAGGAAAAALDKWDGDGKWVDNTKESVKKLLSLSDEISDSKVSILGEGGTFFLTMSGLGIGLGVFGLGGAGAAALTKFETGDWATKVKDQVKTLLEIPDLPNAGLGGAGTFIATMGGLALGLAVFALGKGAEGIVSVGTEGLEAFTGEPFAERVKSEVKTLLEIPDLPNAGLGGAGNFIATMGGLAIGLAAFALGKGAEGLVSVGTEGLEAFTGEPFAERVKSEVKTLLEIPDLPNAGLGGATGFIGVMGGLALGLAAFALGKGVEGTVEVGQEALSFFTGQTGFAERVKSEVKTLLEIPDLPGVTSDTFGFIGVMGGIATGLLAFSASKGISGAITFFTGGESFADGIKKEVGTLLSVTDNLKDDGSNFSAAMGNIAEGLLKFSAGDFGASFVGVGTSILNFLSGGESPIEKVLSIADNAGKLTEGATALGAIAENLNKFGAINFDGDKFNIKGFAEDLKSAVPIIEGAIMGDDGGWFGKKVFGLASPEIDYEKAAESIDILKTALKVDSVAEGASSGSSSAVSSIVNNYITNNYTSNSGGGGGSQPIVIRESMPVGGTSPYFRGGR